MKWSSDGRFVYASTIAKGIGNAEHSIFKVAADGSSSTLIASIPNTDGQEWSNLDITSDGRYVVAAVVERQSDIYLLEDFDPDVAP